jgi:hypothetical protein
VLSDTLAIAQARAAVGATMANSIAAAQFEDSPVAGAASPGLAANVVPEPAGVTLVSWALFYAMLVRRRRANG